MTNPRTNKSGCGPFRLILRWKKNWVSKKPLPIDCVELKIPKTTRLKKEIEQVLINQIGVWVIHVGAVHQSNFWTHWHSFSPIAPHGPGYDRDRAISILHDEYGPTKVGMLQPMSSPQWKLCIVLHNFTYTKWRMKPTGSYKRKFKQYLLQFS